MDSILGDETVVNDDMIEEESVRLELEKRSDGTGSEGTASTAQTFNQDIR